MNTEAEEKQQINLVKVEKDEIGATEVEEAEINAYMESDKESPNKEERRVYLQLRYKEVVSEYLHLKLQKEELEGRNNTELINQITTSFRENYKARKWVVSQLKEFEVEVNDPFIK